MKFLPEPIFRKVLKLISPFILLLTINAIAVEAWRSGKIVICAYDEGGEKAIFMMNADGSNLTKLMNARPLSYISLSPDCERIAFDMFDRVKQRSNIYVFDIKTGRLTNLTEGLPQGGSTSFPRWSPDSRKIVFAIENWPVESWIYIMGTDGGGLRKVCEGTMPDWSFDGRRIAFYSKKRKEICVIDVEGRNLEVVTNNQLPFGDFGDSMPWDIRWSPDGEKILFEYRHGIYVVGVRGDNFRKLTKWSSWSPCWSPNGRKVAFVSDSLDNDERPHIYLMDPDGSGVKKLMEEDLKGVRILLYFDWMLPQASGLKIYSLMKALWGKVKFGLEKTPLRETL
ncbi:PD40 domain-containing protein [Candidatus Poribacteria bacterium]|nr:PD40 domain-containing protein [Candidatus Poribacteria bacterium]